MQIADNEYIWKMYNTHLPGPCPRAGCPSDQCLGPHLQMVARALGICVHSKCWQVHSRGWISFVGLCYFNFLGGAIAINPCIQFGRCIWEVGMVFDWFVLFKIWGGAIAIDPDTHTHTPTHTHTHTHTHTNTHTHIIKRLGGVFGLCINIVEWCVWFLHVSAGSHVWWERS